MRDDRLAWYTTILMCQTVGTGLLLFGWLGFNAGSALGANIRAVLAAMVTFVAASAGGLTWLALDCEHIFLYIFVVAQDFGQIGSSASFLP